MTVFNYLVRDIFFFLKTRRSNTVLEKMYHEIAMYTYMKNRGVFLKL